MYILVSRELLLLFKIKIEHTSRKLPCSKNCIYLPLIKVGCIYIKNHDPYAEIVVVVIIQNVIKMNSAGNKQI